MSTFVSVGNCNQSFARLLNEVGRLSDQQLLPSPVLVQHGHTPFSATSCKASAFLTRVDFDAVLADSILVISHGGATVLQAVRAGKVPVVMPRRARYGEHIDDHQLEFAQSLAITRQIVIAEEPGDLVASVRMALQLQSEKSQGASHRQEPLLLTRVSHILAEWESLAARRSAVDSQ